MTNTMEQLDKLEKELSRAVEEEKIARIMTPEEEVWERELILESIKFLLDNMDGWGKVGYDNDRPKREELLSGIRHQLTKEKENDRT